MLRLSPQLGTWGGLGSEEVEVAAGADLVRACFFYAVFLFASAWDG
jgi:hypothetical protein